MEDCRHRLFRQFFGMLWVSVIVWPFFYLTSNATQLTIRSSHFASHGLDLHVVVELSMYPRVSSVSLWIIASRLYDSFFCQPRQFTLRLFSFLQQRANLRTNVFYLLVILTRMGLQGIGNKSHDNWSCVVYLRVQEKIVYNLECLIAFLYISTSLAMAWEEVLFGESHSPPVFTLRT